MRLVQYDPWSLMDQLRNEVLGRLASVNGTEGNSYVATSDWAPAVDIQEHEDRYVLFADVPGVEPGDIEISMENGCLSIKGERPFNQEERKSFKRLERPRGTFYRRFTMPDSADPNKITAKSHNGVLEITIRKQEKLQPRRITIEQ
jgi:HSP20 family protein